MKTVKVYDLNKWLQSIYPQYEVWSWAKEGWAFFEGEKGYAVFDTDGCGHVFYYKDLLNEDDGRLTFDVGVVPEPGSKSFPIFPEKTGHITLEILKTLEYKEVNFGEWVRTFGSRIENNYSIALRTIKEIGLDPEDYPRKVEEST